MRLIKVCLPFDRSFWFWNNISLTPKFNISPYFDIDDLDPDSFNILDISIKKQDIKAFDKENNRVTMLSTHRLGGGDVPQNPNEDDIINEEDLPEIISITCTEEEPEEEIQEEDYDEARILLSKNGNTVRKTIAAFQLNDDSNKILKACLEIEKENKNRKSIIKELENKLGE